MSGSPIPTEAWPAAELGPLRRIRVLAGATRGAAYAERRFEVGLDRLWEVVADLEHELPHLVPGVRSFRVLGPVRGPGPAGAAAPAAAAGERFQAVAAGPLGYRERFSVLLRPGWCLMQSRILLGAMAAEPEEEGTRFAFLGAFRVPGGAAIAAARRYGRPARDAAAFARLEHRIAARSGPGAAEGEPGPEQP